MMMETGTVSNQLSINDFVLIRSRSTVRDRSVQRGGDRRGR